MPRSREETLGFGLTYEQGTPDYEALLEYANLKLAANGLPTFSKAVQNPHLQLSKSLLTHFMEKNRLLTDYLCPADNYINDFLNQYLAEVNEAPEKPWLPAETLNIERHGLARLYSLPPDKDTFKSEILESYRVQQGVCHNPINDRRTTKGVFHICEGGFAVPADKVGIPKITFARMLRRAFEPPREILALPFTASQEEKAETFVSLLLRPTVCPEVPGITPHKSLETRFFAPGNLVANLDFVETIFGNAGDPFLPENDARLDTEHWSGHTGCVILALHLKQCTKKELGLPHISEATNRQKKDGMCWETEDDLYNNGQPFKATCRNHRGVMVTLISDNYFGYCKKEVKTQISYAANLYGQVEEEHAGGALTFPRFDLGEDFHLSDYHNEVDHTYAGMLTRYVSHMDARPEGYAVDKTYDNIYFIPENVYVNLRDQKISWENKEGKQQLKLLPEITYIMPSGYKLEMIKPMDGLRWRIMGTTAEGTFCHKPCTVSGGGKSEISKPITDAMITGPIITHHFEQDFELVKQILDRDYSDRYTNRTDPSQASRPLLSKDRSLGSVVVLLSPNPDFTDAYNEWLDSIPRNIRDLVLLIKRFWKDNWEAEDWQKRFSVDVVNGEPAFELKYRNQKLATMYLRVGFTEQGAWRTYSLRKDFWAAQKIQMEDDITASVVVPGNQLKNLHHALSEHSFKFTANCEYRLFQRPDEAIIRGHDKTAEADFGRKGNFFSNYEPLTREKAGTMREDVIEYDKFTPPMQDIITKFLAKDHPDFFMSTSHPRVMADGLRTKNPRYLQTRLDLMDERGRYIAEMGARMHRRIPLDEAVHFPVNSVLTGRRNNPADLVARIRPLAVYNPIHYQQLPELFMDFIASLTGKSPSTTGTGSEGALTKGPFNCLPTIIDLNNALVSYLVCGHDGFSSAAGYIGHKYRVDHDISLLIPEIWSRMFVEERDPDTMIANGHLEKVEDFEYEGKTIRASRLGYRITRKFVATIFGRIFSSPDSLFEEDMLQPELQSLAHFADGVNNIVETQQRVAEGYFEDGTVELACPPLYALLHIMAKGEFEGKTADAPEIRARFKREALLKSDWYHERLVAHQQTVIAQCDNQISYLEDFLSKDQYEREADRLSIQKRLEAVHAKRALVASPSYLASLNGTLGTDPAVLPS
ncbi:MAG: hypothetical protein ACI9TH_000565 [Kiritimatiellia bacterium]|jgi:phosphoenolpyruvate carboxykinase (diphosphate)